MANNVGERLDVFAVRVGGVRLVMPSENVAGVVALDAPTRVPRTPEYILGLLPHGEGALAVVDFETFLALAKHDAREKGSTRRVVIVRSGELEAGLACEHVFGVASLEPTELESPSVLKSGRLPEFVRGEYDGPGGRVGLLDVSSVLEAARLSSRSG